MQARDEQRQQKGKHKERGVFPGCINRAWVKQLFAIKSFPFILLASPLFTNCQFAHKWSVWSRPVLWLLARVERCTAEAVLRPDTALQLQQLLLHGKELVSLQDLTWLHEEVTNLDSALLNLETEPLKCQMLKIRISAIDTISDEEFWQSCLKISMSEDLAQIPWPFLRGSSVAVIMFLIVSSFPLIIDTFYALQYLCVCQKYLIP